MTIHSLLLIFLGIFICACSDVHDELIDESHEDNKLEIKGELNESEEKALDALDRIQISGHQLYSTFPNYSHNRQGIISSFKISQTEFEEALLQLLNQFYLNITKEERIKLASIASKAQEAYNLETRISASEPLVSEYTEAPLKRGMWIFKSLLNQRDLIIKW